MRCHALLTCLVATLATTAACAQEELVIDDFEYDSADAAGESWRPAEQSLPVGLIERNGGTALQMNADFTGESRRAVYDRDVDLDLSRWGRFSMDLYIDRPGLFGSFTIYFRSGDGWYAAGLGLGRKGWNTVQFSRSEFQVEDHPAGWHQIDGIRLAAWRGASETGSCAVDDLVAYRETRAIVMGTNTIERDSDEGRAVQSAAETVSSILAGAGVMTSTIGDADVEAGALEDFEIAIFAYNPDMSEAEVEAIGEYVNAGGHIMVFYSIPDSLAEILGVRKVDWTREEYEGQFDAIRFEDVQEFAGMPDEVGQHSWNINIVEPVEGRSRVLGRWYDRDGANTGYPAFIASDAGIYMSHILLAGDRAAKERMIVAMLGHYLPDIWPQVAQTAINGPEQIGHVIGTDEAASWIEDHADAAPDPEAVTTALADYHRELDDAGRRLEAEEYPAVVDVAGEAWARLREAYTLVHRPRDAEFRAWWNHSGTGAYDTWEESMANLEAGGFNAVVPNMLWGGVALYESEYLPHHPVVAERGDQIAECVEAARRHGIEVHPWKVNWNLGHAVPEEFVQQLREEGRLQRSYDGEEIRWLCPSDPRNFELELNTMVEVARNYDVDGVHFDYIRYPGSNACFCDGCRERFQRDTGIQVENWPQDTRDDEEIHEAWVQWRCDNISRLVEATAREVRAIKPHCKISAAVFRSYPGCREGVGQDWVHWIEQGWLDFVCPMDYITSDASFAAQVATQMEQVAGRVPLYPGIGAWRLDSPDRVAAQIHIARHLGTDGFILFNYSGDMAETVPPALGKAMLSQSAVHPHNAPAYAFEPDGEATRRRTYGFHVEPGATVRASVRRGQDVAQRMFGAIDARVVLQDAGGRTVQELAAAPGVGQAVEVSFTVPEGLHRLAVVGTYNDGTGPRAFTTRSLPIIGGEIAQDLRPLL